MSHHKGREASKREEPKEKRNPSEKALEFRRKISASEAELVQFSSLLDNESSALSAELASKEQAVKQEFTSLNSTFAEARKILGDRVNELNEYLQNVVVWMSKCGCWGILPVTRISDLRVSVGLLVRASSSGPAVRGI